MSDFSTIQSLGFNGGINIFNQEYVPSNKSNYNLVHKTFFTIPYKIDSIATKDDIIVIGISEIQSVYVYKIIDTVVNLVKIITPQSSNILGSKLFGKCVKINQLGIFISDPLYNGYGSIFLYYSTNINANTWNINPVIIKPFDYKTLTNQCLFGETFDINDSTLYVSAPEYTDTVNNIIGKCYFYSINYNTKYISNIIVSNNPDKNINGFGNNVVLSSPTTSLVTSINSNVTNGITYTSAGNVYLYTTDSQTYTDVLSNPFPKDNSNYGYSIYISGSYMLISEPNYDEGRILLYKGGGTKWEYINYMNISSLKIDSYNDTSEEGLVVFILNTIFLWTYNNIVYVSEITEAGNIIPSTTDKLINNSYSTYGTLITNIGNNEIIVTGYDGTKSIFDIYTINNV
ncbi:MAG: integrin alpha beta-propellor repeat protein [Caudoviricetes sp.]|nr:MAG: integrin alpha beta-propellor repeat protein [Caudoviricetes sp.]